MEFNEYFTEKIAPKKPASDVAKESNDNKNNKDNKDNPRAEHSRPNRRPHNNDRGNRPERNERAERNSKPEHTERPERSERNNRTERSETSQVAENYTDNILNPADLMPAATDAEQNAPMTDIIGVRFKDVGKVYYFAPCNIQFKRGDKAVVETARGVECGEVVLPNRKIPESTLVSPLKKIIRKATETDIRTLENNLQREKEIMKVFSEKIHTHKLDMKPIDVDVTFDGSKILFYFTSDGRVDFRELVKDLAAIYRTRIELRQIGVRDEAKLLGGLGICGRPFCCSSFLGEFQPVSIRMAKEQSLSLNPTKISGTCGRLMCCLKYEQHCYEDFLRTTPKVGAYVETPDGRGTVEEVNLLTGILKIKLDKKPDVPLVIKKDEVKVIKDGKVQVNRDELKALKNLEGK